MGRGKLRGLIALLAWLGLQPALAGDGATIMLDPGHTPRQQGALGVRGVYEVVYNDHFAAKLADALRAASFTVRLTREPGQSLSLTDRATIANDEQPALFLAIHHDSAQLAYLKKIELASGAAYQTTRPIGGYSIFVSKANPAFPDAYRFAEQLGQALLGLGRPPTPHHAEDIAGERREWLNERLGIYRFDDLVVLHKTRVPAVLLEVGVIVDPDDERYVSQAHNQDAMCQAIVDAVRAYLGQGHAAASPPADAARP
ncbi:N-acetylmuramoyl-L-alanine amidase [Chitinivorax sp. PXF-14]|uniref:N-acetylmuramoyl-L-alanine amidase family protein n=1 Tax=Chitinivorax sp. PXF-14 TaxID=3230488 RepID=UPI0034658E64